MNKASAILALWKSVSQYDKEAGPNPAYRSTENCIVSKNPEIVVPHAQNIFSMRGRRENVRTKLVGLV